MRAKTQDVRLVMKRYLLATVSCGVLSVPSADPQHSSSPIHVLMPLLGHALNQPYNQQQWREYQVQVWISPCQVWKKLQCALISSFRLFFSLQLLCSQKLPMTWNGQICSILTPNVGPLLTWRDHGREMIIFFKVLLGLFFCRLTAFCLLYLPVTVWNQTAGVGNPTGSQPVIPAADSGEIYWGLYLNSHNIMAMLSYHQ